MSDLNSLSQRQLQTLKLLVRGHSNPEIADLLGISPHTVKDHVGFIFKKLEVSNRAEASNRYSYLKAKAERDSDPKIKVLLLHRANIEHSALGYLNEFSSYLNGWGLFKIEIAEQQQAKISDCYYFIEFERFAEEGTETSAIEYSWSISRFNYTSNSSSEIDYYEKIQHELDYHCLIDLATLTSKLILADISSLPNQQLKPKTEEYYQFFLVLHLFNQQHQNLQTSILDTCEKIIASKPQWSTPHAIKALVYYRGMTHFQIEMNQQTLAKFSHHACQAYHLAPNSSWAQTAYGHHCMVTGDTIAAIAQFEESLRNNPCNYIAANILIQLYAFQGDYTKGKLLIDTTSRNHTDLSTVINTPTALTILHYFSGNHSEAKKAALDGLMYKDANYPVMLLILISVAEIEKDQAKMEQLFNQWQQLNFDMSLLNVRLKFIKKFLTEKSYQNFTSSLLRAGLNIQT